MSKPIVSLCIPTNGVIEWVIPVLDSIYSQNVEDDLFEVVIADNGLNVEFEAIMVGYAAKKKNFIYKKTTAQGFLNQTESYKIANGQFIKFINHRMLLLPGAVRAYIDFAIANMKCKPIVYFSNGKLARIKGESIICDSFDLFVNKLSYWSSWSAGIALWKKDFDQFITYDFNTMFPHTDILFSQRDRDYYIIDNRVLLYEIPTNWALKGKYDLFNAFAVEYIAIILDLYRDGSISKRTFLKIKRDNYRYISDRFIIYIFLGKKSSFDLSGYKDSISFFYSKWSIKMSILRLPLLVFNKIIRKQRPPNN